MACLIAKIFPIYTLQGCAGVHLFVFTLRRRSHEAEGRCVQAISDRETVALPAHHQTTDQQKSSPKAGTELSLAAAAFMVAIISEAEVQWLTFPIGMMVM